MIEAPCLRPFPCPLVCFMRKMSDDLPLMTRGKQGLLHPGQFGTWERYELTHNHPHNSF